MFYIKNFAITFCTVLATGFYSVAQIADYPVKGEPCPDFSLDQLEHYEKNNASLSDFRGKWLILYFWTTGCPAGVAGFKKMDQIQSEFGEQLQVLLIGRLDQRNNNSRELYEKFRMQYNYKLAVAYETNLFKRFVGNAAIPHIVIIKPDGTVYAVTEAIEITPDAISDLLQGIPREFSHKYNQYDVVSKPGVHLYKPLLVNENGGKETDFLYRSLLSKCPSEYRTVVTSTLKEQLKKGQFQAVGLSIPVLYKYAYVGQGSWGSRDSLYGIFSNDVAIEVKEPANLKTDWTSGEGRYNYSVIVPQEKASEWYIQEVMRRDLNNYFGYDISIEKRNVACWKLVVKDSRRLKYADAAAAETQYVDHATIDMSSGTTEQLLWIISAYNQSYVFVDSTKVNRNIQVRIDGDLSNFDHLRNEMNKNGLELVKDFIEMNVLVIRDPT